ncbi:MAG TPA: glutaredoxin [Gaiellaceae bacterium]|nr:glutaredoxin [Gaiellaceae bacterium]
MLELFQTEWCRGSKQVRQRLTELRLDFVARQVPADRDERDELEFFTGVRTVPVLRFEDGGVLVGADRILDYLSSLPEPPDAASHRERARQSAACASTPSSPAQASPPAAAPTS